MVSDFCVTALEEAIGRFGKPAIFNTDQGSQFTSFAFTNTLKDADIRISMDGRGRWMDNVFIERLWRSLKYECVYLNVFETGSEARTGIGCWVGYYNADRPHSVFGGRTPDEVYATQVCGAPKRPAPVRRLRARSMIRYAHSPTASRRLAAAIQGALARALLHLDHFATAFPAQRMPAGAP